MPHRVVQLKRQREDVMIVGTVAHNETAIRLVGENLLGSLTGNRSPIPAVLKTNRLQMQLQNHSV